LCFGKSLLKRSLNRCFRTAGEEEADKYINRIPVAAAAAAAAVVVVVVDSNNNRT